ncbi:isoprenylcysteine carboxylmethyltransferase family protein [Aestuariivirga sp.]|uniref:methyltransferase family protein n=1 Tax=Aestuariivirga sp. TaxID=2650926 RepID=UPI0035941CB0
MTSATERPNTIPWPPLIYLGFAGAGVILHQLLPLGWPEGLLRMVLAAIGLCLVCGGLALELVTALTFRRHRTTILPHRGATALITDGPFARSRNPIYVGNTLLVLGAGLLMGAAWLIPAAFAAAFTTQKLAIEREERHLSARFGKAWDDYAARTPRWLAF